MEYNLVYKDKLEADKIYYVQIWVSIIKGKNKIDIPLPWYEGIVDKKNINKVPFSLKREDELIKKLSRVKLEKGV